MKKFIVVLLWGLGAMTTPVSAQALLSVGIEEASENLLQTENIQAEKVLPAAVSLETEEMLQYPELPTGCESVALTILLKYHGFQDIEKTTIVDQYLPYSDNFAEGFSGNPYSEGGGGCYAPGIALAAKRYLDDQNSSLEVNDISGSSQEEIYEYLAAENPVLIWTTMYFSDSVPPGEYGSFQGQEYEWNFNEHCVVLTGYDTEQGIVEVNDPLEGKIIREEERFWKLYEDMGSMAVVIE